MADSYLRRIIGEIPTVVTSILVVIACFIGYSIFSTKNSDTANSVGASVVNAVIIIILGMIYRIVARLLTIWENHRYS